MTLKQAVRSVLIAILAPVTAACLAAGGRIAKLRLWHLRDDRIGHLVGDTDLYLRRRHLGETEPGARILGLSGRPCNAAVVDVFARRIIVLRSLLISRLYHAIEPHLQRTGYLIDSTTLTIEYREFADAPPLVDLTAEEEARGRDELARLGIGENDWWVCFHARDTAYLNERDGGQFAYHSFRNHDVRNMIKAMRFVTAQGGFAIRMGSAVERPLQIDDDPRILDYATTWRTDFMDLYLSARCRYFVGGTSGLFHIAKAFGVPYLMTNLIGYTHMSPQPNSLFIPKRVADADGLALTFDDCADLGLFDANRTVALSHGDQYDNQGLRVVENSDDEIVDALKDLIDLAGGRTPDAEVTAKQRLFKDRYYPGTPDRHAAGNLAPSFIARHWQTLGPAETGSAASHGDAVGGAMR